MIRTLSSSNVLLADVVKLDVILSTQAVCKTIHSLHLPLCPVMKVLSESLRGVDVAENPLKNIHA